MCVSLTFEEEMGVVLKCVVGLLHGHKTRMYCFRLLVAPGLCDQLGSELKDQAENAVDDVHDGGSLLC